jgi:hypothetical protein
MYGVGGIIELSLFQKKLNYVVLALLSPAPPPYFFWIRHCVGVAYTSANYKCDHCDVPGDDSGARTTIFCLLISVFVYVSFLLGKKNFFVYCHVDLLVVVCTGDRDLPVNFRFFCGPS